MKRVTMSGAVATAAALLMMLQLFGAAGAEAAAEATAPVPPAVAAEAKVEEKQKESLEHKEKLFLANYATSTELKLSLTTSTVPLSCFSAFNGVACTGRSARFLKNRGAFLNPATIIGADDSSAPSLDASMAAGVETSEERASPSVGSEDAKKFFTVWSVHYSTTTLTTTYTDSSITVSLSAMCIPPGGQVPTLCPG